MTLRLVTRLLKLTDGKPLPSFPKAQQGLELAGVEGVSPTVGVARRGGTVESRAAENSFYTLIEGDVRGGAEVGPGEPRSGTWAGRGVSRSRRM